MSAFVPNPPTQQQLAELAARVARLEVLVRQLQAALPPLRVVSTQEVPSGR